MLVSKIYCVEIPLVALLQDQQIFPRLVVPRSGFADALDSDARYTVKTFSQKISPGFIASSIVVKASGARN